MRNLFLCLSGLILWGLLGCEQCGIEREPTAQISFFSPVPAFKKVRVLGSGKDTLARRELSFSNRITAPIDLNANQTTYIFESTNRTDTLTVFYDKKVFNASNTCGYVLDIEAPFKGPFTKSTFQRVDVQYLSLYRRGGLISGNSERESMYINVSKL